MSLLLHCGLRKREEGRREEKRRRGVAKVV
jgi:hypothetical protein